MEKMTLRGRLSVVQAATSSRKCFLAAIRLVILDDCVAIVGPPLSRSFNTFSNSTIHGSIHFASITGGFLDQISLRKTTRPIFDVDKSFPNFARYKRLHSFAASSMTRFDDGMNGSASLQ
jgi:hypothetical protein